jgi:hypothetical protein
MLLMKNKLIAVLDLLVNLLNQIVKISDIKTIKKTVTKIMPGIGYILDMRRRIINIK